MTENIKLIKRFEPFVLGFCKCGCNNEIKIRTVRGYLQLFDFHHTVSGKNHPNWKGGRKLSSSGYWMIFKPDHPRAKANKGYVFEHILVKEAEIGRYLREGEEEVHHDNEDKQDNRIENLILMPSKTIHLKHHKIGKHKDMRDRICFSCKSNTTYICKPSINNDLSTNSLIWYHLPWDKENWYCSRCYHREYYRLKYLQVKQNMN